MVMKFVRDQYPQARFKRIYNASTDGWDAVDFYRYCDNKERTLTIVKTTDNFIFGGFTTAEWIEHSNMPVLKTFVSALGYMSA
jgi:hypothetical protein